MLRKVIAIALMICPLFVGSSAIADAWKDESGHGKRWKEGKWKGDWGETPWWGRGKGHWDGHFKHGHKWGRDYWGETPWWGRGKGYWDGHFKHGKWGYEIYGPPRYHYAPTWPYYDYYAPPPPPAFYEYDDDSWREGDD